MARSLRSRTAAVVAAVALAVATPVAPAAAQVPPVDPLGGVRPGSGVPTDPFGPTGVGGPGGLGGPGDLTSSPLSLTGLNPGPGSLNDAAGRFALGDQQLVTSQLVDAGALAIDPLRLAAEARRLEELRRAEERLGRLGRVGPEVPYAEVFNLVGARHEIDPRLLAAVARVESGFDPDVVACRRVSSAGARGIMQLMPATAASLGVDPCVVDQAVDGGARYLRQMHDRFDTWDLALAAYNAGPGRVDAAGRQIPNITETRNYVVKVNRFWAEYRGRYPVEGERLADSPRGDLCLQTVRGITVACHIAGRVDAMVGAAAASGVTLTGGGFRSTERQIELRRINGCPPDLNAPASRCRVPTAPPGRSMHEVGEAIDFVNCGRSSACFTWLSRNASRYGFYNLPSESWHWSTNGR